MNIAEYAHGPLDDVLDSLTGDNPPSDPVVLRIILARCVAEVIDLKRARFMRGAVSAVAPKGGSSNAQG